MESGGNRSVEKYAELRKQGMHGGAGLCRDRHGRHNLGNRVCMRRDEPRGRKAQEIWRGLIFSPTGYIIYVSTWGRKGFDGGVEVR